MSRSPTSPHDLSLPRLAFANLLAVAVLTLPHRVSAAEPAPAFNRDIKPILSDHCYACHGPDPGSRKAGLRLDTKEGLFETTPKRGPAVVAGKPEDSELWKRVITTDTDDLMPPKEAHKDLSHPQKDLLRRWIADGAPWEPHWAFIKPTRPATPNVSSPGFAIRNPIDAFVLTRLAARGLTPAPEADRRTLARRLALDLTGLPPEPQDVERFVQDTSADAYDRLVRKFMDSPRWGEHRARYWLDAARYADTHGLHFDNYREMWPYRDWVIRAFNRNQPFDDFTVEQIAGDLLTDPSDDQLIATGFQRCNATTNEGGTIEEENLVNYANDRVTTVGWVWLGLTANCASCHDHKFDPLTMRDFYSMAAYFRNTTQSGFDGNIKEGGNAHVTVIEDPADRARWKALPQDVTAAKARVAEQKESARIPFEPWAKQLTPESVEKALASGLVLRARLNEGTGREVSVELDGTSQQVTVDGDPVWTKDGRDGASFRFENKGNVPLGNHGDFDLGQPFSFGGWVYVPKDYDDTASIVARMDEGTEHRGWDLWIQKGQFATHFVHRWPEDALKIRTKKNLVRKGEWQHVFVAFDGTGRPEGTRIYVDGAAAETETEGPKRVRGSIKINTPLRLGRRHQGSEFKGGSVQDFRLYHRLLAAPEVKALARMEDVRALLASPFADWKTEARDEVFDYFLLSYTPFQEARQSLAKLEEERESLRVRYPVTHIQQEKKDSMPMAAVLFRGQYDKPKDKVAAGTPPVLHPMPEGAPTNRLGLATWLVSPNNPLTARVTVNRFWQEVFGIGLVRTTEDFGIMGEPPANPELLDWLAVEFEESGWDVKHLFRLLVTSSAYRQSAATTPEKLEKDPANRLISRGPRFRMDAEMVRDYALAAADLLDRNLGGPSAKPYQPAGVWEAVAMPESNTREYKRDAGVNLYRRSLYTFWKRSAPPALMDLFNAPSRESCTVRRERTNTPLQALATLNDPQFIEAARVLAERALRRTGDPDGALSEIAARVLGRPLQPEEWGEVHATLDRMRRFYESQPSQADQLLAVGDSPVDTSTPRSQLAALTLVANQLLNLDEALNK
ncbi:MAG: DUF1553 domain-containing protein [Verrucomicrobiales bacterium]|nr:DUF1553 domain-containing protein [Verrucomicrobiales bacterium]